MIRAGALFVAVTISFVIALLISLLILIAFHHKQYAIDNLVHKKLERNALSAINLLLGTDKWKKEEISTIDLFGEGSDSVQIKSEMYGVFDVAAVKAFSTNYSLAKAVVYGYQPDENQFGAIYLTDLGHPLNLCGKTIVTGNCFLPEAGAKRGFIEGKSFEGSTLINGEIKKSKTSLPELNKKIIEKLYCYLDKADTACVFTYKETLQNNNDTIAHSFLDTTQLIQYSGNLTLPGKYYSGNIVIRSDKSLTIDAAVVLEDVIVVAPVIIIRAGFKGSLQAFATDSIVVEENCELKYPSCLGLLKKDYRIQQPYIKIKKKSNVSGIVFSRQSENIADLKQTLIILEEDAVLHGQLYADGFADIRGIVKGMVWCNKFLLHTRLSTYENHLMNAVIDKTKLSGYYVGSALLASGKKKKIVKWMD